MNNFWGLIPRYIFKNRKRNLLVAISIVLSAVLTTSLSGTFRSFKETSLNEVRDEVGGDYDVTLSCDYLGEEELKLMNKQDIIQDKTKVLAFGKSVLKNKGISICIDGYEDNAKDILNFKLQEGKFPKANNEIALEDTILRNMTPRPNIGDTIKLDLLNKSENSNDRNKVMEKSVEFKFVGAFKHVFLGNRDKNSGKAYVTSEYAKNNLAKESIFYTEYLKFKPTISINEGLMKIRIIGTGKVDITENNEKAITLEGFKIIEGISKILYLVVSIISAILISNIFNYSIMSKTKEFAMLKALGATPRDIKKLVLGEGITLGIVFIPLGIVAGNVVCKGVISILTQENYFKDFFSFHTDEIFISFIIGFLSIMLGTYSSAHKASKISSMQAINSMWTPEKKNKSKKRVRYKEINEDKSFIKSMSKINLSRNRKRTISTIASIAISITLFIVVNYLISTIDQVKNFKTNFGGDFILSSLRIFESKIDDNYIQELKKLEGIKSIEKEKRISTTSVVPKSKANEVGIKEVEVNANKYPFYKKYYEKDGLCLFPTEVYGYSREELEELCKKHNLKIDISKMENEKQGILIQSINNYSVTNLEEGEKFIFRSEFYNSKKEGLNGIYHNEITISSILKDESIKPKSNETRNIIVMSNKVLEKRFKIKGYNNLKIILNKNINSDKFKNQLKDKIKSRNDLELKSYKEELEVIKKKYTMVSLILYSFVAIVSLVSAMNIISIMRMNVILRKKEFGMIRAIGLSKKEIKNMMKREGTYYGIRGSILGIVLSFILIYIIQNLKNNAITIYSFLKLLIVNIAPVILVFILLCLFAAINACKEALSNSIIKSMSEEN